MGSSTKMSESKSVRRVAIRCFLLATNQSRVKVLIIGPTLLLGKSRRNPAPPAKIFWSTLTIFDSEIYSCRCAHHCTTIAEEECDARRRVDYALDRRGQSRQSRCHPEALGCVLQAPVGHSAQKTSWTTERYGRRRSRKCLCHFLAQGQRWIFPAAV